MGRARFEPEGLVAGDGPPWPWDEAGEWPDRRGWHLHAQSPDARSWVLLVVVEDATALRRSIAGRVLMLPHRLRRLEAMAALPPFLHDHPAARAGLADPARVTALLAALRARRPRAHAPHEPMMGDAYDVHHAVLRALRDTGPVRYQRRPADTDPLPDLATVVAAARGHLRPGLRDRVPEQAIAERAAKFLAVDPWPFSPLL
ncbi:MAG TPA: hypothetical protein VFQ85_16850 [Mycobacteriales bacterium]|nr:hypothetical protein [Mycobacteriales bacterium]